MTAPSPSGPAGQAVHSVRRASGGPAVPAVAAAGLDALLVVVFAAIGRRSHDESSALLGVLSTAWPFLLGAAVGWAIAYGVRRAAPVSVRDGVLVWVPTVAVGMLLRVATGAGTAPSFIVVASIATGILLLGWRALAARRVAPGL